LLGFVAYKLATGSAALPGNGVAPVTRPANDLAAGNHKATGSLKPVTHTAEPKKEQVGETKSVGEGSFEKAVNGKPEGQPVKSSVDKKASTQPAVGPQKSDREKTTRTAMAAKHKQPKKRPAAKRKRKRKQEVATVIREEPVKEAPVEKKPVRHKKSSGGILDFDDEDAFAKETGGAPVARKEKPKEVKKVLPPLSNADVLGVMRKHLAEFKACNRKQQEIDRSVKGKMVVKFIINPSGRVATVTVATARFKNTFVSGCISKVIKQASFPAFGGNPKAVPFPFTVK
jgi:hypothetical protein